METVRDFIFGASKITTDGDCSHEIKRPFLAPWKESFHQPRSKLKSRDITLPTKVLLVKAMVFPVVMYGCESWTIKKAEHQRIDAWTVMLKKTLESPLACKNIKPVNKKGIFIGRTDAEAEAPILWSPDMKNWLIGKDPAAGKDWRREEKEMTEDDMVGWHHQLDGHGFEQAPGVVMDREAWRAAVHGVAKSQTWVSDWTELNSWKTIQLLLCSNFETFKCFLYLGAMKCVWLFENKCLIKCLCEKLCIC